MITGWRVVIIVLIVMTALAIAPVAQHFRGPEPGHVVDEARLADRAPGSFTAAGEDYFHDMDGGIALTPEEIKGRDTWIVWTGGNDKFWDTLTVDSFGSLDLLKTLSSYPTLKANRDNRWNYLGAVNEPCFDKATGPDPARHGLWLDHRSANCPPDPFEDAHKYPGVRIGARGGTIEVGSYYGYATGVIGLRLFPNPAFDKKAAKAWDPVRYYTDPSYYNNKALVRPYRVGMSCAFCHVGPSATNPPTDPDHPRWANLSSTVGAQYLWFDRVLSWQSQPSNFVSQLFSSWRPGSLDTSLVSTDNINNPRTMNAVYLLGPRLALARRFGQEALHGGALDNRQINDFVKSGPYTDFFRAPNTVWTPHVLKDGSDSVGVLGALNRVYINIGTFSEEWLLHFNPIIGGKPISPMKLSVARANSSYFAATEEQTLATALFLIKASRPDRLSDAPGGAKYLTASPAVLTRGKVVFAENCARCHSSKLPTPAVGLDPGGCAGPRYLDCFGKYWAWTQTADFKAKMRRIVLAPDFLTGNYLSSDIRVPVTLLHTNACSPLATNALANDIWDNFSSQSYKDLPSVGDITWYDPYSGAPHTYHMPAGGRGYTRVPSLVSLWSTAPFLLNNSVGPFDPSPSVDARMRVFQTSIEQMLWPERRERDSLLGAKIPGKIDRTTTTSYLRIPAGYLPDVVSRNSSVLARLFPGAFGTGANAGLEIGPIPAGTPVGLLSNVRLNPEDLTGVQRLEYEKNIVTLIPSILHDLKTLPHNASDAQGRKVFAGLLPRLLAVSKCPDLVVNRGHYFGTNFVEPGASGLPLGPGLSDDDKRALIAFLKTL
jgi:hypothetical protein